VISTLLLLATASAAAPQRHDASRVLEQLLYPEMATHESVAFGTSTDLGTLVRPSGTPRRVRWTLGEPGDPYQEAVAEYDRSGERTSWELTWIGFNEPPRRTVDERDERGLVLRRHFTDATYDARYEWDYDDLGRPTSCRRTDAGGCREYRRYEYEDGLLRTSYWLDDEDQPIGVRVFEYDEKSQVRSISSDRVTWNVEWRDGLPVRKTVEGGDGSFDWRWNYRADGTLLSSLNVSRPVQRPGALLVIRRLFDHEGWMTVEQSVTGTREEVGDLSDARPLPALRGDGFTEYHARGVLLGRVTTKQGVVEHVPIHCEFDSHGNWVLRSEPGFHEDVVTTRTIEYWD
jgi:hypothetical protein